MGTKKGENVENSENGGGAGCGDAGRRCRDHESSKLAAMLLAWQERSRRSTDWHESCPVLYAVSAKLFWDRFVSDMKLPTRPEGSVRRQMCTFMVERTACEINGMPVVNSTREALQAWLATKAGDSQPGGASDREVAVLVEMFTHYERSVCVILGPVFDKRTELPLLPEGARWPSPDTAIALCRSKNYSLSLADLNNSHCGCSSEASVWHVDGYNVVCDTCGTVWSL